MQESELGRDSHRELQLSDYLAMVARHWLLMVAVVAFTLALAVAWVSTAAAQYESTATVVLRTTNNQGLFPAVSGSQANSFTRVPTAEIEYVQSTVFVNEASERSPAQTRVTASFDEDDLRSSQIAFTAKGSTPAAAQGAADAWADFYLESRRTSELAAVQATAAATVDEIARLEEEKTELLSPLQPIVDALQTTTDPDTISRLTTQRLSLRETLEDELLPITIQIRLLSQDLAGANIQLGVRQRSADASARLLIEASPGVQVAPRTSRTLALGALLGLVAAVGAMLVVESLRQVIHSGDDVQSVAPAIPILAQLPEFPRNTTTPMELAAQAGGPYAQALERIVSSLLYERLSRPDKKMSVVVTSSHQAEGKTTVATHVAFRLGSTPSRSILVDADMRRPDVHNSFGVRQSGRGLGDLLRDGEPLEDHLLELADAPHVRVLLAGQPTDNAATLLRESFADAMDTLPSDRDLVLIDAPPVLAVTDAEVLTRFADAAIVVVRAGKTTKAQLRETLAKLQGARATVLGFVLVGVKRSAGAEYQYYYSADESSDDAPLASVVELRPAQRPLAVAATGTSDGQAKDGNDGPGASDRSAERRARVAKQRAGTPRQAQSRQTQSRQTQSRQTQSRPTKTGDTGAKGDRSKAGASAGGSDKGAAAKSGKGAAKSTGGRGKAAAANSGKGAPKSTRDDESTSGESGPTGSELGSGIGWLDEMTIKDDPDAS